MLFGGPVKWKWSYIVRTIFMSRSQRLEEEANRILNMNRKGRRKNEDYPILSDRQLKRRRMKEVPLDQRHYCLDYDRRLCYDGQSEPIY